MKQNETKQQDCPKKLKIGLKIFLSICSGAIAIGATAGLTYVLVGKHNTTTTLKDSISFGDYSPTISSGGQQTFHASSSTKKPVTLTASGKGEFTNWNFSNDTLTTYDDLDEKVTVTISGDDGITKNSINVDLIPSTFNISSPNPNLTVGVLGGVLIKWTSANFTPIRISLSTKDDCNRLWELNGGNTIPLSNPLTLSRKDINLPANIYNVYIDATDGNVIEETSIAVTISNPIIPSFSVNSSNPNLTIGVAGDITLVWTSANFTPTRISLDTKNGSDQLWDLAGGDSIPLSNPLTLSRKSVNLPADVYVVWLKAINGSIVENASVTITISANDGDPTFSISASQTSLTYGEAGDISLNWTATNFTPTSISLSTIANSNTIWDLDGGSSTPLSNPLTLSRKLLTLTANVYNVYLEATDGTDTATTSIAITIQNPWEKNLFFTTGDTTTTPGSKKSFYGTLSASNFLLGSTLKVKVNGTESSDWSITTFPGQSMIKITPPGNLAVNTSYNVSIFDESNNINSNVIPFVCQTKIIAPANTITRIDVNGTISSVRITNAMSEIHYNNSNFVALYFGANANITKIYCSNNQLSDLGVSQCANLSLLECSVNQLTTLDLTQNTNLTYIHASRNNFASLDVSQCNKLSELDCSNSQLACLDVSNCPTLVSLYCNDNRLSSLNVSGCSSLTTLDCHDNQLPSLVVSTNTTLTTLDCEINQITSLDVSNCSALTTLNCNKNQIPSLNVSSNINLKDFRCNANQLTSLNVSGNTNLEVLNCGANFQLVTLNVSGCTNLHQLWCMWDHALSSLDVSTNTSLVHIECYQCHLESLDVSNCPSLTGLICYENQLTSLTISNNPNLLHLDCHQNLLTLLNVSSSASLMDLKCQSNQLSLLDISGKNNLNFLNCEHNLLTSLDASTNSALTSLTCNDNPNLNSIKLPNVSSSLTFHWWTLADGCFASGTVQRAANTNIDGNKPAGWDVTYY